MLSIVADASKFEVEFKSDVNTETTSWPYSDMVDKYGNDLLDMQVGQTDMKVRHIFQKFVEVRILDSTMLQIFFGKDLKHAQTTNRLSFVLRQQTTTWKNMAVISLTFRTSEYLRCLRFPCQRNCS